MQILTATDVARNFSQILDEIGKTGKEVAISRHGRVVARLVPELPARSPRPINPSDKRRFPTIEPLLRPSRETEPLLRQLLGDLEDLGCKLIPPGGEQRRDYVNIDSPGIRGRVLSVNVSSGRAEFQSNSWDSVSGLDVRFKRLAAGNKAAHPLETLADVETILRATKKEIDRRG